MPILPQGLDLSIPQPNSPIDRRDLLNYTGDNTIQGSRYIDPLTRDFVVSSNGHFVGENSVEQQVLLALNTTFGTTNQPGFGQNFISIKTITPTFQNQIFNIVQQALSNLISTNQITIQSIQSKNNMNGQISIQIVYNNNTLGTSSETSFLLQG